MDITTINHCLATAINNLAEQEIEVAAEDMKLSENLFQESSLSGKMNSWDGEDWYFVQKLRDSEIYFRPIKKLKNGNLKGIQVTRYLGERAQKAKLNSVFHTDFNRWRPVSAKEIEKPVLRRIREKLESLGG